jgi:hypothetical protein
MRRSSRLKKGKTRRRRNMGPRRRFTQRGGGGLGKPLLDGADAPPINTPSNIDFNARFQPTLKCGMYGPLFTIYQTAHEPYAVWTPPTPPAMYTIMCWDPDVPQGKSFLHWMVTNCSGVDVSGGKIVAGWVPPAPPPGTGEHRYVIGLFNQTGPIQVGEITDRTNFNATTFSAKNSITPVSYIGFRVVAADKPPAGGALTNSVNTVLPLPPSAPPSAPPLPPPPPPPPPPPLPPPPPPLPPPPPPPPLPALP